MSQLKGTGWAPVFESHLTYVWRRLLRRGTYLALVCPLHTNSISLLPNHGGCPGMTLTRRGALSRRP